MTPTVGILAGGAIGATAGYALWKDKLFGAFGGGLLGAIVGMFVANQTAIAVPQIAPSAPPPAQLPGLINPPTGGGAGQNTYTAIVADSGAAVPMAVGDKLNIELPAGSGTVWFYFTSTGEPAKSYQGIRFDKRSAISSTETADAFTATDSLGGNVVQVVAKLLPVDSSGNPIQGSAAISTFTLWVGVT
jgi:hypothetical protein